MAEPWSQSGSPAPRSHRRQASKTQPVLVRTSTNDPLSTGTADLRLRSSTPTSKDLPIRTEPSTSARNLRATRLHDFSFLLRSEIYHPLTNIDSLPAFRSRLAATSLTSSAPIPELLKNGQFRLTAIAATNRIVSSPSPTPSELFSLFYIRLASLTLLDATDIAAAESVALGDLSSVAYINPETGENLLPWSLRLIAIRLQSLANAEPRRALTGYYDLATEARDIYSKISADDADGRLTWKARLRDLGIRVANCLVEMGDWDGAKRHLESLRVGLGEGLDGREEDDMLRGRVALVLLRIGDLDGARRYLTEASDSDDTEDGAMQLSATSYAEALRPLLSLAHGNYSSATAQFRSGLIPDALARQNRAICAVYAGRLNEARDLLQGLVDDKTTPRTIIFNLSTTFELLSDKARNMKLGLAETIAARDGGALTGWEIAPARFKLSN